MSAPRLPGGVRALLALAAVLVPARHRDDWLREWRGELWAAVDAGRPVGRPALGALVHGAWLRGDAVAVGVQRLAHDLGYGARALGRRPAFAFTAIATLALGIGATTAVFTVVDAVLLAPLPYPGGERFVRVRATFEPWDVQRVDLTPVLLTEWRSRARGLEAMEGYAARDANLVGAGLPAVIREGRATAGFLPDLLGLEPVLGRTFDAGENAAGGRPVAVLSERAWRSRLGSDPGVLGRSVRLDDRVVEVVGVVPDVAIAPGVEIWTPHPMELDYERQRFGAIEVLARARNGVTVAEVRSDLLRSAALAAEAHPDLLAAWVPEVEDFRSLLVSDVQRHLWMLFGAVLAVLLIACGNVAGLVLGRAVDRAPEIALRRSLGASRGHLASHVLAEGLVLGVAGGVAGLALAFVSLPALLALVPAEIPLAPEIGLDGRVLGFTAALTLGVGALVGLLPLLRLFGRDDLGIGGGGRGSASRARLRTGRIVLGVEVAQACALLVAAGLMVHALARMSFASAGFDAHGLTFVHLSLPAHAYPGGDDRTRFLGALSERLERLPGVRASGVGTATPFSGMTFMAGLEQEGGRRAAAGDGGLSVRDVDDADRVWFSRIHVDESFLGVLGLPLLAGRALSAADFAGGERVGLVSAGAAAAFWPGESPVGQSLLEGEEPIRVVGVVGDVGHPGLRPGGELGGGAPVATLYVPLARDELGEVERPMLLVRAEGSPRDLIEPIRRAVWEVDPELPIPAVATAVEELGAGLAVPRFYALLLGIFGGLALTLSAVGVYGVVAQSIGRRLPEIGIRLALGASSGQVGRAILREGMTDVAVAMVAGLAVAAWTSRLLSDLLYGVEPTDPWTYAAIALLLGGVSALAILVPARRAMRADPVEVLRAE